MAEFLPAFLPQLHLKKETDCHYRYDDSRRLLLTQLELKIGQATSELK